MICALSMRVVEGTVQTRQGSFYGLCLVIPALARKLGPQVLPSDLTFSSSHHPNMETLDNSEWDVVIVGTGLQQSLLALYAPVSSLGVLTQSD
jgi:hypothetical protein